MHTKMYYDHEFNKKQKRNILQLFFFFMFLLLSQAIKIIMHATDGFSVAKP